MKFKRIYGKILGFFLLTFTVSAGTVPFDTSNYNFSLDGDGGGAQGTLNGASVESFCDDFNNSIWVPYDYSANVTTLSTSANLDETRFGQVTSWTTIHLTGSGSTATLDDGILNGADALGRYEMAAYLVSLYNLGPGGNAASNNELQQAIWTLMDPKAEGSAPSGPNPTTDLEAAASWYSTMNTAGNLNALNSFLANFEIVSSSKMTFSNGLGIGGFQEQIVDPPTATPEPRLGAWMLIGLFGVGGYLVQRARGKKALARVHCAS
jgi:hypothetical protein